MITSSIDNKSIDNDLIARKENNENNENESDIKLEIEIENHIINEEYDEALDKYGLVVKKHLLSINKNIFDVSNLPYYLKYCQILILKQADNKEIETNIQYINDIISATDDNKSNNEEEEEDRDINLLLEHLYMCDIIIENQLKAKKDQDDNDKERCCLLYYSYETYKMFGQIYFLLDKIEESIKNFKFSLCIINKIENQYSRLIADLYFNLSIVYINKNINISYAYIVKVMLILERHLQVEYNNFYLGVSKCPLVFSHEKEELLYINEEEFLFKEFDKQDMSDNVNDSQSIIEYKSILKEIYVRIDLYSTYFTSNEDICKRNSIKRLSDISINIKKSKVKDKTFDKIEDISDITSSFCRGK